MFLQPDHALSINRRTFLHRSFAGIGGMAMASLAQRSGATESAWPGVFDDIKHFAPKAKRVIHLCMAGGPSHLETFDYKPELAKLDGKAFPDSFTAGQQLAQLQGKKLVALGPVKGFRQHGESGLWISDYFPHLAEIADDLCIINSMRTEQINHDPAHAFMNTGSIVKGRPSMGSWMLYGLGAETENLPGYIVLISKPPGGRNPQPVSSRQWSAGFLPSKFQGVQFQSTGDAVHFIGNPEGICQSTQRQMIDEVKAFNGHLRKSRIDPEIDTRISQYEMAFRMQASVPELTDMSGESQQILDMYGVETPGDGSFGSNCLMARRMLEQGVRFVQLYHRGWDHHGGIEKYMGVSAQSADQASAALIKDLKQRGMLEDTLVIWGGEFGRTPMGQGNGRDHHINAFSIALAGGGIKGGVQYGKTDELGYGVAENEVTVHDLHATMLHLCGINDARFTYQFQGLDFKLSGVEPARVVKDILA
ncbi:sulfatase [Haloferula helveola]|uniref:Sulfatase n=1 Tax=Haloferula helveola TaxID=490095 RepID=A0ABN6H034_9BACT|nr:sulfatase [Haloferula helveola]